MSYYGQEHFIACFEAEQFENNEGTFYCKLCDSKYLSTAKGKSQHKNSKFHKRILFYAYRAHCFKNLLLSLRLKNDNSHKDDILNDDILLSDGKN